MDIGALLVMYVMTDMLSKIGISTQQFSRRQFSKALCSQIAIGRICFKNQSNQKTAEFYYFKKYDLFVSSGSLARN